MQRDILIITPPFTQLNTPYPASAYLKGFLKTQNISCFQADLGIEAIVEILSKKGLSHLFDNLEIEITEASENAQRIYALKEYYIQVIDEVILFLQGKNQVLAKQICAGAYLPQASRYNQIEDLVWAFGQMGMQDQAKHLATLFIEDLADFMVECVDSDFGFSRYAERLGFSANSFDEIYSKLKSKKSYIDKISNELVIEKVKITKPKIVAISVPFPGNLFSAFRCAEAIKEHFPAIKVVMGGGFANTELRSMSEVRVFEFFDFVCLDQGELPLKLIFENVKNDNYQEFKRTYICKNNKVEFINNSLLNDFRQAEVGTPDYSDLHLDKYISVIETTNPMHSLWSDGRWNKLTLAHGCYWAKCTFCDISLNYIKNYEPAAVKLIVDKIIQIKSQTNESGFHFVDEAAPPALMRDLAIELIKRKVNITWWTNIRFEKSFTADLCGLLKASGCIAVSGGLEVASNRLLALIDKGVTVEQVSQVCRNFTEAGIMVHSYLMYGFPSQTEQETVDSLEMVRQMFELGIIQSGFWHQFALTAHSPVGLNPEKYQIIPKKVKIEFADNDIQFTDKTGINHSKFSFGLKKSLYNYMQGQCFEYSLDNWFDFKIPNTKIKENFIYSCLDSEVLTEIKASSKIIWLGVDPKMGIRFSKKSLILQDKTSETKISMGNFKKEFLLNFLSKIYIANQNVNTFSDLKLHFGNSFDEFWHSNLGAELRENGLMVL